MLMPCIGINHRDGGGGSMRRLLVSGAVSSLAAMLLCLSSPVRAGNAHLDEDWRWWLEGGIGGGRLDTRAQGLPGRHGAAVLSLGIGFRATPQASIGFEYSTNAALSGCQRWDCQGRTWDFMPAFNRATLFGEMRFFDGRMRLRYGVGDLSYCHAGGAGMNLWYLAIEALAEDDTAVFDCSAVHGLVKSASIGYHWHMPGGDATPLMAGLKLGVEDSYMHGKQSAGLPPFHYRAVTLTFQLSFN
jgi:hypothetical protein